MRHFKRGPALLLALLMLLSLTACGGKPEVYEVARVKTTTTSTYAYAYSDGDSPDARKSIRSGITEYDERGLATRLAVDVYSDTVTVYPTYSFDEQGNPDGFSFLIQGVDFQVKLENRYEDGQLREVAITEVLLGEKPLDDALAERSVLAQILGEAITDLLFPPLENYLGYRDCCLHIEGGEEEIRYEGGRQVYSCRSRNMLRTEMETRFAEDGGETWIRRNLPLNDGITPSTNSVTRELDAGQFLTRVELIFPDESRVELRFRLEDGGLNEGGEPLRLAYAGEIRAEGGETAETAADKLREKRDVPFAEYSLYPDGSIRSCFLRSGLMYNILDEDFWAETRIWYDRQGRAVRQETHSGTKNTSQYSVTETEYR